MNELKASIWFTGPDFMIKDIDSWPKNENFDLSPETLKLEKKKRATLIAEKVIEENLILQLIKTRSSIKKLNRIVAYIIRFIINTKNGKRKLRRRLNSRVIDPLTAKELDIAFLKMIEVIQSIEFADEMQELEEGKTIKNNRIQKLNPFLQKYNSEGLNVKLLRVGGCQFSEWNG